MAMIELPGFGPNGRNTPTSHGSTRLDLYSLWSAGRVDKEVLLFCSLIEPLIDDPVSSR